MKFRWKRMAMIVLPLAAIVLFPYWYRWLNPDFYSSVRCVKQTAEDELVKAAGAACAGDEPALVLRRDR